MKKRIKTVSIVLFALYIITGIIIYWQVPNFLFQPDSITPDYPYSFKHDFEEKNILIGEHTTTNLIRFSVADSSRKGIIIHFHGNKGNLINNVAEAGFFTDAGYELWVYDYPGYGKSTGTLTEDSLYIQAQMVYQLARTFVPAQHIVLHGKSLGAAIAANLATKRDCKALVLETPYYSWGRLLTDFVKIYPAKWLSKYRFPTNDFIKEVIAPVYLINGDMDEIVNPQHAKDLQKLIPTAQLLTIEHGEHNNLASFASYRELWKSILK